MTAGHFQPLGDRRGEVVEVGSGSWLNQFYAANSIAGKPFEGATASCLADEFQQESSQHFQRRVQLFFLQLITVWKTPYVFEWQGAEGQYGTGTRAEGTVGAHSSTLPCLIAYPRGVVPRPEGFVYLKHSHSYTQHNGTVVLPGFFNDADSAIDGKHGEGKLRDKAIGIVNAVAEGRYGVREGMRFFMQQLWDEIERAREGSRKEETLVALERYSEFCSELSDAMEESTNFDRLLGVKLKDGAAVLRDVVFASRFKLIQDVETKESEIARKILDAQNAMLGQEKKSLKYVDCRLRYVLLEEKGSHLVKVLQKLFCTSIDQLRAGIARNEERLRAFEGTGKIRSFRKLHERAIANLKRDLRALIHEMDQSELQYRSGLFKGLRERVCHWRGKDFVAEFRKRYPDPKKDPMSLAMVSRIEHRARAPYEVDGYLTPLNQRRKDLDVKMAVQSALTFGIDPGLLLPAVVSSIYA